MAGSTHGRDLTAGGLGPVAEAEEDVESVAAEDELHGLLLPGLLLAVVTVVGQQHHGCGGLFRGKDSKAGCPWPCSR